MKFISIFTYPWLWYGPSCLYCLQHCKHDRCTLQRLQTVLDGFAEFRFHQQRIGHNHVLETSNSENRDKGFCSNSVKFFRKKFFKIIIFTYCGKWVDIDCNIVAGINHLPDLFLVASTMQELDFRLQRIVRTRCDQDRSFYL